MVGPFLFFLSSNKYINVLHSSCRAPVHFYSSVLLFSAILSSVIQFFYHVLILYYIILYCVLVYLLILSHSYSSTVLQYVFIIHNSILTDATCLIPFLSDPILSDHILFDPILSDHILSDHILTDPHPLWSHPLWPHPLWSHPLWSYPHWSLSSLIPSSIILSSRFQSYYPNLDPVLSFPLSLQAGCWEHGAGPAWEPGE